MHFSLFSPERRKLVYVRYLVTLFRTFESNGHPGYSGTDDDSIKFSTQIKLPLQKGSEQSYVDPFEVIYYNLQIIISIKTFI